MNATPAKPLRSATAPARVRCAIYTRVSTDERLGQEFNSLHNQRESAENYIKAQRGEGWETLPGVYEDPGFSGGTMDRPGLRLLLADVAAGKIDRVIVYKIDRLTRSLLDFGRLAETFEKHGASIVSVTQQFDTSTSMGRLTLNMLLSFAQFEREMIAERTSDKMAASRRKGKWVGGVPVLGYDIAPEGGKLLVNQTEAALVRQIFDLYLEHRGLIPVVQELRRRGWTTKSWKTRAGHTHQGTPFTKEKLRRFLSNQIFVGKVHYLGKEIHEGEHEAIVDQAIFDRVQDLLQGNRLATGAVRGKYGAILLGLLRCGLCGKAMTHAPTTHRGKTYRYYRCRTAIQHGRDACRSGSVSAPELERLVVDQVRDLGKDPQVVLATLREAQRQTQVKKPALKAEMAALKADMARQRQEIERLVKLVARGDRVADAASGPIGDLQEAIQAKESRIREIQDELKELRRATVDEADLRKALSLFDPVWDALFPAERQRILHLLIERVDYDAGSGTARLTFRPTGIRALAAETKEYSEE